MPDGQYFVYVEEYNKTVVQSISLKKGAVEVRDDQSLLFSPAVVVNNNKLDYTLLRLSNLPVRVQIIDEQGRVNYNGAVTETGSIERRFDIGALSPGTYQITTTVGGQTFRKKYSELFTVGDSFAGN